MQVLVHVSTYQGSRNALLGARKYAKTAFEGVAKEADGEDERPVPRCSGALVPVS